MDRLLPRLREDFDNSQDRFECFTQLGVQLEGWFKGELLYLFSQLLREKVIAGFDREVKQSQSKIDLVVDLEGVRHWIELKHWLIGRQKGITYGPDFYFKDLHVGICKDVEKLVNLDFPDEKWLLLLLTANPKTEKWQSGLEQFNSKFAPRRISSQTDPEDFPDSYFLGLLRIEN